MKKIVFILAIIAIAFTSCNTTKKTYNERKTYVEEKMVDMRHDFIEYRNARIENWDEKTIDQIITDVDDISNHLDSIFLEFEKLHSKNFDDIKDCITEDKYLKLDYNLFELTVYNWRMELNWQIEMTVEYAYELMYLTDNDDDDDGSKTTKKH